MGSRIDWKRVKTSTVVTEAVYLALALAMLVVGWMSFPLVLVLVAAEIVSTVALSALLYRERSASRHLVDVLKILALCAFCAIFLIAAYLGAGGFRNGSAFDLQDLAGLFALLGARIGVIAFFARRSGDPRLHWAREALRRGGVLVIAMFLSIFACFIPGIPLAALLKLVWPEVAADVAIGGVLLSLQAVLAIVMSTMTEKELADIAQQPYLD